MQKAWKECFSFLEKLEKRRFSFREKYIRDGFNVTFSLVRKSNQKVPQRATALWTPRERFKIPSGEISVESCKVLRVKIFCVILLVPQIRTAMF